MDKRLFCKDKKMESTMKIWKPGTSCTKFKCRYVFETNIRNQHKIIMWDVNLPFSAYAKPSRERKKEALEYINNIIPNLSE